LLISACLLVIFAGTLAYSPEARQRALSTNSSTNESDNQRKALWQGNFEIVKDYPLLGAGYSQNKLLLRKYYDKLGLPQTALISHAHNQYLHFWAGTGTLGLLFYLAFLYQIISLTLKSYIHLRPEESVLKALSLGALGGQICFIVGSLTESNFSISKNRYIFLLVSAVGVSIYYRYIARKDFDGYANTRSSLLNN
jgi:O-antigen ligase